MEAGSSFAGAVYGLRDILPADLVARWGKQIDTKYAELDDQERESPREQVRKYLPLIASALAERVDRD